MTCSNSSGAYQQDGVPTVKSDHAVRMYACVANALSTLRPPDTAIHHP